MYVLIEVQGELMRHFCEDRSRSHDPAFSLLGKFMP